MVIPEPSILAKPAFSSFFCFSGNEKSLPEISYIEGKKIQALTGNETNYMLRIFVHSIGLQKTRWNFFGLSSWWKTSALKYSSNNKKFQRCWDGSKCKILSYFLNWYKPLPVTAELPPDIFLPDFLQAGWAPILQTAARCWQQKGHCHLLSHQRHFWLLSHPQPQPSRILSTTGSSQARDFHQAKITWKKQHLSLLQHN